MYSGKDADETVPPAVLEQFGSIHARPHVRSVYTPRGHFRLRPRPLFTTELARRLEVEGVYAVKLVWRGQDITMSFITPGPFHVWRAVGDQVQAGMDERPRTA